LDNFKQKISNFFICIRTNMKWKILAKIFGIFQVVTRLVFNEFVSILTDLLSNTIDSQWKL